MGQASVKGAITIQAEALAKAGKTAKEIRQTLQAENVAEAAIKSVLNRMRERGHLAKVAGVKARPRTYQITLNQGVNNALLEQAAVKGIYPPDLLKIWVGCGARSAR